MVWCALQNGDREEDLGDLAELEQEGLLLQVVLGLLWIHVNQAQLRVEVAPEKVEVPHVRVAVVDLV